MYSHHNEAHFVTRTGWLRAAVMGANDGILSTASIILGVAAAGTGRTEILLAGLAGLIAGAMSMAAGEYVSVSSQSDLENADLDRERTELEANPAAELKELATIYEMRGLSPALAQEVATQLTANNALEAHARDELGISDLTKARPVQAALASAATFTAGGALPVIAVVFAPMGSLIWITTLVSVLVLGLLGLLSAKAGGAPVVKAVARVTLWGIAAMGATAVVGHIFGAVAG